MKSKHIIVLITLVVIILLFIIFYRFMPYEKKQICFNQTCLNIETAKTFSEREKGLMFRETLKEDLGMLFIFDNQENRQFWMKNTLISLDLIGLDKNLVITDIKENFQPCKSDPCEIKILENSKYVLEVNAGIVKKFDLTKGIKAELN